MFVLLVKVGASMPMRVKVMAVASPIGAIYQAIVFTCSRWFAPVAAADIIGLSEIRDSCVPMTQPERVAPITGIMSAASPKGVLSGICSNFWNISMMIGNMSPIVAHADPMSQAMRAPKRKQMSGKSLRLIIPESRVAT